MNTILSMIIMILQNSLKQDNNYIIASYILQNLDIFTSKSMQEVAQDCHVSTNTLNRFCSMLGFDSYRSFRSMLESTIKNRQEQLIEKNQYIDSNALLEEIKNYSQTDFDYTYFQQCLNAFIADVHKVKMIHLYAATFPLALSQSFIEDMAMLGVRVFVHQINYTNEKMIVDTEGIHVLISYSGRFMEVNHQHYQEFMHQNLHTYIFSQSQAETNYIPLPKTSSIYYDDFIYLHILDYIVMQYSKYNDCLKK